MNCWRDIARPNQLPPEGDWRRWLMMTGAGWGSTRAAAEATHEFAQQNPGAHIALVGPTLDYVLGVMVRGESGLLSLQNPPELEYERHVVTVKWENNAWAFAFTPRKKPFGKFHFGWAESLSAWSDLEATWSALELTVDLGESPRIVATTRPRPIDFFRQLATANDTVLTTGSTFENAMNLPKRTLCWASDLVGSRIGCQEVFGRILNLD